jgi:hypothetical protein
MPASTQRTRKDEQMIKNRILEKGILERIKT